MSGMPNLFDGADPKQVARARKWATVSMWANGVIMALIGLGVLIFVGVFVAVFLWLT